MSKGFWAVMAIIAIIFGGILFFKSDKTDAPGTSSKPTNHVEGQSPAGLTLVEYGDYQCPVCANYHPVVQQVVAAHAQDVKFQFRNLPLTQIHQNAFAAARAAEAASLQNKFWEMHNKLYENQPAWAQAGNPQSSFEQYATQIGLNSAQFKKDFTSSVVNNAINSDIKEFNKTKQAPATPTFFLNGKKIEPSLSYNEDKSINVEASVATFSKILSDAVAKAAQTAPTGSQNPQ